MVKMTLVTLNISDALHAVDFKSLKTLQFSPNDDNAAAYDVACEMEFTLQAAGLTGTGGVHARAWNGNSYVCCNETQAPYFYNGGACSPSSSVTDPTGRMPPDGPNADVWADTYGFGM